MRRVQWAIFPIALAISLLLPHFTEAFSSIVNPQGREHVEYVPVRSIGWRDGIAALCFENLPAAGDQITINVTSALRCSLFRKNETPVVWLGSYKLRGVRTYDGDENVVLELERGGRGEAYVLRGLPPRSEVYALLEEGGTVTFVYLFRVVEDHEVIEVKGSARGASRVEAYAYAAREDFNASQPPSRNLFITGSEVVEGRFLLRMEKGGAPLTRQGKPLLEVNNTLVLYTGCSYAIIDLAEYSEAPGSIKLAVNLDCEQQHEQQVP